MVAGRKISCLRLRQRGVLNIYIRDMHTGEVKQVSPSPTSAQIIPAWSPDGKWLAFQDETGVTSIVNIATGKVRALTPALFVRAGHPGRQRRTIAIVAMQPYTRRFREGTNKIRNHRCRYGKDELVCAGSL